MQNRGKKINILEQQDIPDVKKALMILMKFLCKEYNAEHRFIEMQPRGNFVWIECDKFDLVLTITNAYENMECLKIEELRVNEKYRNQGIGTHLLNIIKEISDVTNKAKVGFWVDIDNKRLQNFYERLGFVHKETIDDMWYEYN